MTRTSSIILRPRPCLVLLFSALIFTLLSVIFHFQRAEHKTLWTRDIDRNSTVTPKVLINWDDAIEKGYVLSCAMDDTVDGAAHYMPKNVPVNSQFVQYSDLAAWGWSSSSGDENENFIVKAFQKDLTSIDINPDNFIMVKLDHDQPRTVDEQEYPPSGGRYYNFYNTQDGAIIVANMNSPEDSADHKLPRYPKCARWSDVTFLQWQQIAGQNIGNLKHVFYSAVTNDDTLELMATALDKEEEWYYESEYDGLAKGKSFLPGQEQYEALLYSPNIRGLAWLLIQHKPQLGIRRISKITIFGKRTTEVCYAAIYLEIEEVS
ncbi:hypothetical protein DTO164E3_3732 [Paecilomyces variotii]|nr:hypothetical protein DTO164E3_3732 [Paecilomyces variotii]